MTDRPKRLAPISWRVTLDERQWIKAAAAASGMSVNSYINMRVFRGSGLPARKRQSNEYEKALSAILAKIGQSNIPNNLNQLAKLAHSGSLAVTSEVLADFDEAKQHMADIKRMVMAALALREGAT